jgi:predicted TPR repeat methyltransferase
LQYDDDLTACGYSGPRKVRETVEELNLGKDIKILDVLTGTGFVAREVINKPIMC